MNFTTLSDAQLRDGIAYVRAVAEAIHTAAGESRGLTTDEQTAFDEGLAFVAAATAEQEARAARRAAVAALPTQEPAVPDVQRGESRTDPFSVDGLGAFTSAGEFRSRALSAIERATGDLDDDHREAATRLIQRSDTNGDIAKRVLLTGSDAYRSGWQKVAGGHPELINADERAALERASLSLTDANGGYAVPFTLDPTIIYTGAGAANPFRQVCRTETITTDTWNGVTSSGVTGGYAAEGSEVGDDAPTLGQPSIKPERWDVFVEFSFEIGMDWVGMEGDLRMLIDEKRDEFDVAAFTTGSGSDEPFGFVTGIDGGASEIAPGNAETFAVGDVYALEEALGPRYRRTSDQAKFMAALGTYQAIRQFATDDGHALWSRIGAGRPGELLGYGALENSVMDSTADIDAGASADNFVLAFGDWRNYVIVDRVGLNLELVPHMFATANNRPNGKRGFLAWGRTGGKLVNPNGIKLLSIPTAA